MRTFALLVQCLAFAGLRDLRQPLGADKQEANKGGLFRSWTYA